RPATCLSLFPYTTLFRSAGRCECGAPIPWGSHFCPNCGRPAGDRPVIACVECGHPLPGDAVYCANCGATVAAEPAETGGLTEERSEEHTSELQSHLNLVC